MTHHISYIKYVDENGRTIAPHLGEGVTPEIAAKALGLAPDKYTIITKEEAEKIQHSFEIEEDKP